MTGKAHIFILIAMLGFFLIPASTYACETKSEKSCCKKEIAEKTEKKDCCEGKRSKGQGRDCGGKCGHSNCITSITQLNLVAFTEIEFNANLFDFVTKKQKFYHKETDISSGFYSVWSPPKIN